jgi:hypothetical protein
MIFIAKHIKSLLCLGLFLTATINVDAWGFWAHKKINNKAVATLPQGMTGFYRYYIDFISDHAVDADKKRYCAPDEAPRHFIDLDHYCQYPCDSMPRRWKDAVAMYGQDTLLKYGTLPWHICLVYYRLVNAFKDKDPDLILKTSSDLGHYIADSYVPLHATLNYDGQYSGQWGMHAFWETNIPEWFGRTYNYHVAKAQFISNINDFAWAGPLSGSAEVDSVLSIERNLHDTFPLDKMYCLDYNRQDIPVEKYTEEYGRVYSRLLNGMVERRMRESVHAIGSLWMSAWIEAGQPDLESLIGKATNLEEEDN